LQRNVCDYGDGRAFYRIAWNSIASGTASDLIRPATNPLAVTKRKPRTGGASSFDVVNWWTRVEINPFISFGYYKKISLRKGDYAG
jgi:hypothetical protein